MARTACSLTRVEKMASTSALMLMSPSPTVTGSMRMSTLRTMRLPKPSEIGKGPSPRRYGSRYSSCAMVPSRMPMAYTQMRSSSGRNGVAMSSDARMTAFHSTGTNAVGVNRPSACSTAATIPVSPSSGTMGNIHCDRPTR